MTTPGTTDDLASPAEETAASLALADGLEAIGRLHADAMADIARLMAGEDAPADAVRVLRLAERPTVTQRGEAAAA